MYPPRGGQIEEIKLAETIRELEKAALEIRKDLLKLCSVQSIHIGGDLSITDVMTVLWQYQMRYRPDNPKAEERDRFVLSKGHASAVMSFNQAAVGCFSKEDIFREYATDGGRFTMHACNLANPFVEVSTGSLGHGMPIACGIAAGLRLKGNRSSRVYTVMGDGEQAEGSIWEAAMNAAHCRLGNLVAILDWNGLEADGRVEELTGIGDLEAKYRAFGWHTVPVDGHDIAQIKSAFDELPSPDTEVPTILLCRTIKGKGVSFMEGQTKWHAGKVTPEQYEQAVNELESAFSKRWDAEI